MSRFKDAVAADIKAVFINGLEFADEHDINGETVMAVVDGDIIQERNSSSYSEYPEGVFQQQIMVFVSAMIYRSDRLKVSCSFWTTALHCRSVQ